LLKKAFKNHDPEKAREFTRNLPEIRDTEVTASTKGKKKSKP